MAGASPGNSTLDESEVVLVVDDEANVELVASGRVVAVVLLVPALTVEDVVVARGNVVLVDDELVTAGPTTTTHVNTSIDTALAK